MRRGEKRKGFKEFMEFKGFGEKEYLCRLFFFRLALPANCQNAKIAADGLPDRDKFFLKVRASRGKNLRWLWYGIWKNSNFADGTEKSKIKTGC